MKFKLEPILNFSENQAHQALSLKLIYWQAKIWARAFQPELVPPQSRSENRHGKEIRNSVRKDKENKREREGDDLVGVPFKDTC